MRPLFTALFLIVVTSCGQRDTRAPRLPRLMLWAWERPEGLHFIDPSTTGVAFLASTLTMTKQGVVERPRRWPIGAPPGTTLVATIRLEHERGAPLEEAMEELVRRAARVAERPGLTGLQLDFDATQSERWFYRRLLEQLRGRIAPELSLTITGLASWCLDDTWIDDLPVDAVIPQLYRMGPESAAIRLRLAGGFVPRPRLCREGLGITTDEPRIHRWAVPTVWAFHPRRWTPSAVADVRKEVDR